jgi:hypothetical protein
MAELKSLGDIFPDLLVDDGGGLIETLPALSGWFDVAIPAMSTDADAAAWRAAYGDLVDDLCAADGSTVTFAGKTDTQVRTVMTVLRAALLANTDATKGALNNIAFTAYNPFRTGSQQDATYARAIKVVTTMYFGVDAKKRK